MSTGGGDGLASTGGPMATGNASQQQQQQAQAQAVTGASTGGDAMLVGASEQHRQQHEYAPTDQAVLDYLRKKGLGSAVLELTKVLEEKKDADVEKKKEESNEIEEKTIRERLEEEDAVNRNQRTLLSKSTGGGYGYDRDAAWPVVQWGIPDTASKKGSATANGVGVGIAANSSMGVEEAVAYLDSFTAVQLWVLSLPDQSGAQMESDNPLLRAQAVLKNKGDLNAVVEELAKTRSSVPQRHQRDMVNFNLPPSAKPELLAVTFALLVHTYCELLEVGMESQAHMLRDAFKVVYEPLYPEEYRDLYQCTTTEHMMRLNSHNSQHMEALASLKGILVQIASYQLKREELNAQSTVAAAGGNNPDPKQYDRIHLLKRNYNELSQKASGAFNKMHDLPFLRRARAVRWQLTMSTTTYGLLASFLSQSANDSKLVMSALLQTKCELHVERRDPMPFTPDCDFEEESSSVRVNTKDKTDHDKQKPKKNEPKLNLNSMRINWAAPVPFLSEFASREKLSFPKFHLDDEYETETEAKEDKKMVEFNRSLLMHGFRRLEALERKREYEVFPRQHKRAKHQQQSHPAVVALDPLEPSILLTTLCANSNSGLVLATSPSSPSPAQSIRPNAFTDASAIWDEPGIGLCCSKACPPDGRRVAVGCEDSAVRVWDVTSDACRASSEPALVLLGHKNGFPVFDVDWGRDGRSLLSAGGDGSVRLWDTMAVGPFGELAAPSTANNNSKAQAVDKESAATSTAPSVVEEEDGMHVPGIRSPEDAVSYRSGAALAVYRGHAPGAPVWSVSFAPSGYYFASAAGDGTARLWTTDGAVQTVRLLCGHTASNVNCVQWHPNCNYVITGSDDQTVRLWDIQTGCTVRLLMGCSAGVNVVKISPGGNYVAGADYSGSVHIWDLGSGKKIAELLPEQIVTAVETAAGSGVSGSSSRNGGVVHSLSFSACGNALATGGDDCCVRIWNIARSEAVADYDAARALTNIYSKPFKAFTTRQTMIMDLQYTKRNLLLAVGKFVTPVPLAHSVQKD